jgi:tetratricopeptide (TPR) repeat protein
MKIKALIIVIVLLEVTLRSLGQDFKGQFYNIQGKNDTNAVKKVLENWRKTTSEDPELYIAYYNFYANRSMTEVLTLSKSGSGNLNLQLKDTKSNKTVGFVGSEISVNPILIQKGFNYIDTGIEKFPNRLDMRFGEIYMLGKIPDYNKFTIKLVNTIIYGEKIGLKWMWKDNKPLDNPENFMLGSVQTYVNQLFNAGDENADLIKAVAETVLKYHPNHVESLSNLAISYLVKKDYVNALNPLLKAEKNAPTDFIVLNNIAYCYSAQGDITNAKKYYLLTEKYGDEDAKASAKKRLEELQKN